MADKEAIKDLVRAAAKTYGVPENLALALIHVESSFRVNPPDAGKGAVGLGQVMPATFKTWVGRGKIGRDENIYDPMSNVKASMLTMQENFKINNNGGWIKAIRRYQGGWTESEWGPENKAHLGAVLAEMAKLGKKAGRLK